MTTRFFIYQNANNQLSAHTVLNAIDKGEYVIGFSVSSDGVRTFRYDRVIEFVDDAESLAERFEFWQAHPHEIVRKSHTLEIHFTGFKEVDKVRLSKAAKDAGLVVRSSMSGYLDFLCCGYNASAKKIEQAQGQGVLVFSETEFLNFLETGEIPMD